MKTEMIHVRVNKEEKNILEEHVKRWKFRSVSEFLRFVGLNCKNIDTEICHERKDQ